MGITATISPARIRHLLITGGSFDDRTQFASDTAWDAADEGHEVYVFTQRAAEEYADIPGLEGLFEDRGTARHQLAKLAKGMSRRTGGEARQFVVIDGVHGFTGALGFDETMEDLEEISQEEEHGRQIELSVRKIFAEGVAYGVTLVVTGDAHTPLTRMMVGSAQTVIV